MQRLETKVPPPLVALLCGALMAWIDAHTLQLALPAALNWTLIAALALAGIGFDFAGLYAFRRRRTTVNPLHPEKASALVCDGVYRITRNPMYVGMACFLTAWVLYLDAPLAWLGVALFAAYITRFQIIPEERMLARLFGAEFDAYRTRVRRWL